MLSRLVEHLARYGPLTEEDRTALASLPTQLRRVSGGDDLTVEGDQPAQLRVMVSGLTFRHRTLPDGRRQITAFNLPGELVDGQGLLMPMDHSVTALATAEVAVVPHAAMGALLEARPRVMRALLGASAVETSVAREGLVGIGRRDARARVAHLFCEIHLRMRAAGLVERNRCRFPATQTHLSDALGLSVVHTNRVLQTLRGDGLITFRSGELLVLDWQGLQAAGEFDAAYLHLSPRRR